MKEIKIMQISISNETGDKKDDKCARCHTLLSEIEDFKKHAKSCFMTNAQKDVYAVIAGYIQDYGYSPTYQEVAEKLGTSVQMVEANVKNIISKGFLKFNGKRFRKLELT